MGVSTATIKRDDLVKRSLRRLGMHYPSNTQINNAVALLNDILKEIDSEGRWLWTIPTTPSTITLIAGQRSYGTVEVLAANRIDSNIFHVEWAEQVMGTALRPLKIIYEFEALSNIQREQVSGVPYFLYMDKQPTMAAQKFFFYPTPNDAYVIQYNFRRRLFDFTAAADNPDFPQDWNNRLVTRLAKELAPEYGVSLEERMLLKQEMDEAMAKGQKANAQSPTPRPTPSQFF